MKFLMNSSRELSFAELIQLNGGYGGSSGGGGSRGSPGKSGSSSYSGSSSGGKSSSKNKGSAGSSGKKSAAYSAASGGIYSYNRERISIIGGKAYSSLTGFISGVSDSLSAGNSAEEARAAQEAAAAAAAEAAEKARKDAEKARRKAQGLIDKKDPDFKDKVYIDLGFDSLKKTGYDLADASLFSVFLKNDNDYLAYQVAKKINSDLKNGSIDYEIGGTQCDNYVQDVLGQAGVDYSKYFAGEAKDKTCAEHIANLDSSKDYSASTIEKGSVYVCFMGGGKADEHCAMLIASDNGGFYMVDNSLGNWSGNGGVNVDYADSVAGVEKAYRSNYSKFYYQKVTR